MINVERAFEGYWDGYLGTLHRLLMLVNTLDTMVMLYGDLGFSIAFRDISEYNCTNLDTA